MPKRNTMDISAPFILQIGGERIEIKERGRLELSRDDFKSPLLSQCKVKLWIGDRLSYSGSGYGIDKFGDYVLPDNGLPELHLDSRFIQPVKPATIPR